MKTLNLVLILFLVTTIARAQPAADLNSDLDLLYQAVKNTPSYKDQFKGKAKADYEQLYTALKAHTAVATTPIQQFALLSKLLAPVKDNHFGFYQYPDTSLSIARYADSAFIQAYRNTTQYKDHPSVQLNTDSLERALAVKPTDGPEGVYYFNNGAVKAAIYRAGAGDSLTAVVLASKYPVWRPGNIIMWLKEYVPNRFNVVHVNPVYHNLEFLKNVQYRHGALNVYGWRKQPSTLSNVIVNDKTPVYQLTQLADGVQYLRLGSFGTSNKALQRSQVFYDSVKNSITAPKLIVDLRNNGGGGWKASKKFLDMIGKHTSKGNKVYVLVNWQTVSNAEQFTLKLKGSKNVLVLGENTKGMVTYGSNYGKTITLPYTGYRFYPTDMNDDGNYLPYEDIGVAPDVKLKEDSDWLKQVLEIAR